MKVVVFTFRRITNKKAITIMSIADFIQLGLLFVAVASIYVSQKKDTKQRKLQMFAEYTRRYQDIFLQIPDDMFDNQTGA